MEHPLLPVSDFQKTSGKRLARLLRAIGLKQTEAADIMGTSKGQVSHWIHGRHPIPIYPLYRLARMKNLDANYVVLGLWDGLPHGVARKLEGDLAATLADSVERDRKGAEKSDGAPRKSRTRAA